MLPSKIVVECCSEGVGYQKYYKKTVCPYCMSEYTKLIRHLESAHNLEEKVQKILEYPKNSKERKKLCFKLQNLGNFRHNVEVLKRKEGILKVIRRSSESKISYKDYACCPSCLGFFCSKDYWRHAKGRCSFLKHLSERSSLRSAKGILEAYLLDEDASFSDQHIKEVLLRMRNPVIVSTVKNDWLLMRYVKTLVGKKRLSVGRKNIIRDKVRSMARLFLEVKKIQPNLLQFSETFEGRYFDAVKDAVHTLSGRGKYQMLSQVLRLGHSLRKCCHLLIGDSLKKNNEVKKESVSNFLELLENEWSGKLSKCAV